MLFTLRFSLRPKAALESLCDYYKITADKMAQDPIQDIKKDDDKRDKKDIKKRAVMGLAAGSVTIAVVAAISYALMN